MDPFASPRGPVGAWAGRVMAVQNAHVERWAAQKMPARGPVLEVGCGPGVGLAALGPRGVGIDISQPMVEQARAAAPHSLVVRAQAALLPFSDDVFEAAMAVHCLALLPWAALEEIRRVLTPGAPLVAVHRHPNDGGPEPLDLMDGLRAAGFQDVTVASRASRSVLRGRA